MTFGTNPKTFDFRYLIFDLQNLHNIFYHFLFHIEQYLQSYYFDLLNDYKCSIMKVQQ